MQIVFCIHFQRLTRFTALTVLLLTGICCQALAAPGDLWKINHGSVNVRTGPGMEHPVTGHASEHELAMELRSNGSWTEIKRIDSNHRGWVRSDLLRPLTRLQGAEDTPWFNLFADMLTAQGNGFFTDPRYLEHAVVSLTTTEDFLALPREARENHLKDLLRLWQTVDNTGIPATVILVRPDGRRLVSMGALTGLHWFVLPAHIGLY